VCEADWDAMMGVYEQLREHIDSLWIVDSHEHLPNEADLPRDADVLSTWLPFYTSNDLISAGLNLEQAEWARDPSVDLLERWDVLEPYWEAARSTGYLRVLDIAARDLFGFDRVCRDTLPNLNAAFQESRTSGQHYQYVMKDRGRIALSVTDANLDCDRRFFASVKRMDDLLLLSHRKAIQDRGREVGVIVHTLGDWKEALRLHLERYLEQGMVALKVGLAYMRQIRYDKVPFAAAERDFNEWFAAAHAPLRRQGPKPTRRLQDHLLHHLLGLCDERGMTVQVHTGIHEGIGNVISDSDPTLLTNLLLEYGDVTFDLFHISYPYQKQLANLAKNFRNVTADMCWAHAISPEASRRALAEFLDAAPANKIIAFGGDYTFVEGAYGQSVLARHNVAAVLARKVAEGTMDIDRAKELATWMLVDNPVRVLKLADRLDESDGTRPEGRG